MLGRVMVLTGEVRQPPESLVNFRGEIAGVTVTVIPHSKAMETVLVEGWMEMVLMSSEHGGEGSYLISILCLPLWTC